MVIYQSGSQVIKFTSALSFMKAGITLAAAVKKQEGYYDQS